MPDLPTERPGALAITWAMMWLGVAVFKYLALKKEERVKAAMCAVLIKKEEQKMNEKKDIKDVKEIVEFGFALLSAGKELFAEGKFHADKLMALLPVYQKAGPAFENIGDALPELKDLDEAEAAELMSMLMEKGVLSEDAAHIAEKSIKVAVAAIELFKAIKH